MKQTMRKLRDGLMKWKILFARGAGYLNLINTGMLLTIFLIQLKERDIISLDVSSYTIPLFIAGLITLTIIGWIEIRFLKGYQTEAREAFKLSPDMVEMKDKINKIYEKIKEDE